MPISLDERGVGLAPVEGEWSGRQELSVRIKVRYTQAAASAAEEIEVGTLSVCVNSLSEKYCTSII